MWNHYYAEVNKIRLHYVAAGQGELIVFLHGFPEFWYEWKHQLLEFSKHHLAVAPDMRGYNLSSKPDDIAQYQMPYLIEDVRLLVEHLGYKKFILVGHDWGGIVAWNFAMVHPEYLQKLIIINAPHPAIFVRELNSNSAQQKASQYTTMFRSPEAEQILSANTYQVLFQQVFKELTQNDLFTAEDKAYYIQAWSQPGALTGGLNYYRAGRVGPSILTNEDITSEKALVTMFGCDPTKLTVNVPTLVIWGERDTALLTGNLNGLEAFVPNLTIKRVAEGSHWLIHERPELIDRYIAEFIK